MKTTNSPPRFTGNKIPRNYKALYTKKHLRWVDLADRPFYVVEIENMKEQTFHIPANHKDKDSWVLRFKGVQKYLILNQTMMNRLGEILGDDPNNWVGEKISLSKKSEIKKGKGKYYISIDSPANSKKSIGNGGSSNE